MLESSLFKWPGDHIPRPHGNCYWLVPGQIIAGEYPRDLDEASSRKKMDSILAAGVTQKPWEIGGVVKVLEDWEAAD